MSNTKKAIDAASMRAHTVAKSKASGTNKPKASLVPAASKKTPSSKVADSGHRKIQASDIQLVQNLIERCLQLYMSQREVISTLHTKAKIEPGFTKLVWQKLEDQNPEFFRAYYTRLKLKDQIILFNHLLEQQAGMYHKVQAHHGYMPQGIHPSHGGPGVMGAPSHGQPQMHGHPHHIHTGIQGNGGMSDVGNQGTRQGVNTNIGLENSFGRTMRSNEHLQVHDGVTGGFGSPGASTNSMPDDLCQLNGMQVGFDGHQLSTPGGMSSLLPLADITDELGDGMNANFTLSDLSLELSNQITDGEGTLSLFQSIPGTGTDNPSEDDAFKLPKNFSLGDMNTLADM